MWQKTTAHRFTPDSIRKAVPDGVPGVYVLGEITSDGFLPKYVGRSDTNVRKRLLTHNYLYDYSYFLIEVVSTPGQAYLNEAKWWHDCLTKDIELANKIHPDSPAGAAHECPFCTFANFIGQAVQDYCIAS